VSFIEIQCGDVLASVVFIIEGELQEIPEEFRIVVYLADVEGFSYKEIAEIVGSPAGTVMSRLHRGRKQLREKLADYAKELGYTVGGDK
jgi:RNA polymerase sigma-70 factor (ECF subfamily)